MVYFLEFLLSNMETFEIRAGPTDLPKTNGRATNKTQHNTAQHNTQIKNTTNTTTMAPLPAALQWPQF